MPHGAIEREVAGLGFGADLAEEEEVGRGKEQMVQDLFAGRFSKSARRWMASAVRRS